MSTEIKVPDIGEFDSVEIIDILVSPGDSIENEQSLITLESDKATMDIPSPATGTVKDIAVKTGQKVAEGDLILTLEQTEKSTSEQVKKQHMVSAAENDCI